MGLYDAMNNSQKEKKEKTLLKDIEGESIGVVRTGFNENRNLAREYGEETFYKPGKKYLISTKGGDSSKGWKADMAENRENKDNLFKKSGSDVAVYGAKVAEGDLGVPKSVAYLDGTMPRKVAKPTAEQTAAVPAATKEGAPAAKKEVPAEQPATKAPAQTKSTEQPTAAVKEETPAPAAVATEAVSQKEETPAAPDTQASDDVVALEEVDIVGKRSQKKAPETTFPKNVSPFDIRGTRIPSDNARNAGVSKLDNYYHRSVLETLPETPAAQSRYDKAIADIEASKSPSRRERRDIRKMEKAAKKLIEDGKKRKETEPQKPQTPAVTEETPAEQAPAAQSTATTTQQEAAKDEVPAQPASTAQQTTKAPAATENDPWKHTKNWWQPSTYVQDEEAYQKLILEQQRREERNEKRRRNRALIADLVNMGVALGSTAGGAVAVPEVPILSKKSNDKLRELREKQAALQLEFAKNRRKARQLDAQDFAKRVKAEVDAEKEAEKAAAIKAYRDEQLRLERERLEIAKKNAGNKGKDNGSGNSKDTWTVEGKTYTDLFDAWVALPEDAMTWVMDEEGNVKVPSTTQMKADLAMYKKNKEANKKTNKQQTNSNKKTTSNSSPQQAKEGNREPKKKEDKVGSSAMADLVKKAEEIMNNTPPSRR